MSSDFDEPAVRTRPARRHVRGRRLHRADARRGRAVAVAGAAVVVVAVGGTFGVLGMSGAGGAHRAQSAADVVLPSVHAVLPGSPVGTASAPPSGARAGSPSASASASPTASASGSPAASAPTATAAPVPSASASVSLSPSPAPAATSPAARPSASTAAPTARSVVGPGPVAGTPASGTAARFVQQIVTMVNAERAKAGCGALTVNAKLQAVAQEHSDDMAARNYYEHDTPEGVDPGTRMTNGGYQWSSWGENIYQSPQDPTTAMTGWMNSPEHRDNILNCAFQETGVGVNLSSNGPWWTEDFGQAQ
ncbi:CAP domain-containing protein [Kitasatospora mediocidica]|uniref:CAP domain-containing protein n=1 Tax=Kitasatospora mediocidica TaxID=58352 RepID=UPI000AE60399|nr:CAP domain-containing protein [Kitasatospora mediocidica]